MLTRVLPFSGPDLADLTAYVESLGPRRPAAPGWTEAAERGRRVFFAGQEPDGKEIPRALRCPTCHRPPLYTDRFPANVSTRGSGDSTEMFDTPHLLGIGASAPYLHDGRAATLEEIWTVHNPGDCHGVTSHLTKRDLNDLVEFLRRL